MKSVRDVRIVAVLFLIAGAAAVARMIQARAVEFAPGLLEILTGIGLLRWRNAWRIVALVTLWIGLAAFVFVGGILWIRGEAVFRTPWGRSPAAVVPLVFVTLALMLWQIRVLTRPNVRRSFELGDPAA